jgi:hypothetical protein
MEVSCLLHAPVTFLKGNSPLHPLNRGLSWPQSRSVHYGEQKYFLPLAEIEHRFLDRPALTLNGLNK